MAVAADVENVSDGSFCIQFACKNLAAWHLSREGNN